MKKISSKIELITLDGDFIDLKRVKKIIEENIEDIASVLLEKFEETTENWESELVEFEVKIENDMSGCEVFTTNAVYGYVNDGTDAHDIVPSVTTAMAFPPGYGGTSPSVPSGPKALRQNTGDLVFTKTVFHPGTEGKDFENKVAEEVEKYIEDNDDWFEEFDDLGV